jgi:hypothetical protein
LQSGVLFLFPHVIKTCLAANTCRTIDFVSSSNMWFRSPKNLFKCPDLTYESTPVTFYGLWHKVFFVCFLQAAGTAIGEIPPFYMTRAARLAAISAGMHICLYIRLYMYIHINIYAHICKCQQMYFFFYVGTSSLQDDDMPEDLQSNSTYSFINRAKSWMV